jgi:hypothetical protein
VFQERQAKSGHVRIVGHGCEQEIVGLRHRSTDFVFDAVTETESIEIAMPSFSFADRSEQRALGDLITGLDFDCLHNSAERCRQDDFHLHGFLDDQPLSLVDA